MNSKELQSLKNKLKEFIEDKEIIDVILFGSAIKGKAMPNDWDIALITDKEINKKIDKFHISLISPKEFFYNPPSLVSTIIKEGYSLKSNEFLAKKLGFEPKTMFIYNLSKQNSSDKVRIVRALRGDSSNKGLVEEESGKWLSNNVFLSEINSSHLFESFFKKNEVVFTKNNLLMH